MIKILFFLLLVPSLALASGLQASFSGARDPCGSDPSLVFCYDGEVDSSGNLVDKAGENLLTDRTEFDDWVQGGTCAVTADQWRNPVDGTKDADYLDNTGDSSGRRWISLGVSSDSELSASVWIRADYDHTCTIRIEDGGGTIDEEDVWVTSVWKRFVLNGAGNNSGNVLMVVYPGDHGVAVGQAYFYGAQLVENDRWRTNQGYYLNPSDQSVTKPDHDLAPTNAPTRALSDSESRGKRLHAREFNGTDEYYSKAHHDSMNVNDDDHTYTFYVSSDTGAADSDVVYSHAGVGFDGIFIYANQTTPAFGAFYFGGGNVDVTGPGTTTNDGMYHVIQVVRESDTATVYVDGEAGTPLDVSGSGLDGNRTLYIGRSAAGAYWDGRVAFAKLESRALNSDELADEREKLWGIYGGTGSALAAWDVSRSTVAMKTFKAGACSAINNKMTEVAANIPRATLDGLLVEGQSTNFCDYSEEFDQWSTNSASVSADTDVALDGSTTADTVHEDATAGVIHNVQTGLNISVTASSEYTASVWVKAINRNELSLQIQQAGGDALACFHLDTDSVTGAANLDNTWIEPYPGGYHRVALSWTAPATETVRLRIYVEDSGCTRTFNGLDQDSFYLWGAQVEEGTFPTSYIETPGTSDVTRTADDITMFPVRFTGLPLDGSETMWIDFSQDPSGATITTSDGGYTLTKNGQPEHHRTEVFGDYHYFNGSSHWSRADDGSFEAAGDFSVVCGLIPEDVSGSEVLMAKYSSIFSADRSWLFYQSNNDLLFYVYNSGGSSSNDSIANGFVAGKPTLVGASYDFVTDGTSVITVFQDDLTPQSMNTAVGPVRNVGVDFTIGASSNGALDFSGELLFCSFIDGKAIIQAEFEAMYESFVQDHVLPKNFSGSGEPDKLTMRVDLKCQYSSSSDIGQTRDLIEIGGNYRTATWTRNRVLLEATQAGRLYFWLSDDADVDHYALTAPDPIDFSQWFGLWFVVDFSDLSRMDGWYRQGLSGDWTRVTSWTGNSGSAELNLKDTMIQIGADPSGTVEANCEFQNLSIRAEEIRP